jgi:hypothetical protein
MLSDFQYKSDIDTLDLKRIKNWWEVSFKLDIDNGTNDLRNLTNTQS